MANGGADLIKEDIEARKDEASSNEDLTKEDFKDVAEIETTIKNTLATHILDPNMDPGVVDTGPYLFRGFGRRARGQHAITLTRRRLTLSTLHSDSFYPVRS